MRGCGKDLLPAVNAYCGGDPAGQLCAQCAQRARAGRQGRPGWKSEAEVADTFQCLSALLWDVLRDGGRKRDAGVKPHWAVDRSHRGAMLRHVHAWEVAGGGYAYDHVPDAAWFDPDPDSGAHPLVHAAARALMIAAQELGIARQR